MNPAEIRALAYVVNNIRPSWPVRDIERALVDDPRAFTDVALAAVTAAASPDTRFPGGIKTTYAGSHGCQKCAERNTRAERNSQPPPITRCEKCGHIADEHHNCRPMKPTPAWHQRRRELHAKYDPAIRHARLSGDYDTAEAIRKQWAIELANSRDSFKVEVMAHA